MKFVTALLPQLGDPAQDRLREWFLSIGASAWMPLLTLIGRMDETSACSLV
jgi:hypothetical protein